MINCKKKKLEKIPEDEHDALLELSSLGKVIIQKANRDNVQVLVTKTDYIRKMEEILKYTSKFKSMDFSSKLNGNITPR